MYICNSITSYDRPSKRENHSLGANPIHINMQGANTSVLISNQANIRNYFEFEYARLNKLGWKIYMIQKETSIILLNTHV